MDETIDPEDCLRYLHTIFTLSKDHQSDEFKALVLFAQETDLSYEIRTIVLAEIDRKARNEVAPQFWSLFENKDGRGYFQLFYEAIRYLYDRFKYLESVMERLERFRLAVKFKNPVYSRKYVYESLVLILKSTLLSQICLGYQGVITGFYECAMKLHDVEEGGEEQTCPACSKKGRCTDCLALFKETNKKLGEMMLLEPLVGQSLTNFIYTYIQAHIQKICKDSFDSSFIAVLEQWLNGVVLKWVQEIYRFNVSTPLRGSVKVLEKKLLNFMYSSYTKTRIDQLFNIIIEYPESLPALEDLRTCLPKTDLKPMLTRKLQKAMETRLLHPGVSTPDVLTAYVAAIKSLRILDPTGLLLETVTQPVHQYLRSREDTVRCVVSSLTEEGPNDLAEELVRGEAVQVDENTPTDDDGGNWETWTPDPVDAAPSKTSVIRRTSDIISMLVNVYGSKELFVNEYRTLLADRLLTQYCCDTEKEIRYLELLKLRFGDSQLHYCEVMLKDVGDSKRINQHIKQDPKYVESEIPMSAMIVSAQFWPPFKEEKLELHERLLAQRAEYTKAFETLKGSRTLCWKNHLGMVEIEVELADRTLNLSVSPVQATIMMHFQDKNSWELEELSKVMQCPPTVLRRKISFWQSHGILVETSQDVFCVQEDLEKSANVQEDVFIEDYEAESAMASAQDQREEELQTFWSYIVGMLMNLDTLPLERIHQMLKMFAFQGPTIECNLQELKIFLDRKVREHQLIYSNGYYKLPK